MSEWSRVQINLHQVSALGMISRISTAYSFPEAVALGLVADNAKSILLMGRRVGVDTTDCEAWPAITSSPVVRTRSDTASALYLISSSANDNASGTGARLVACEYIDADGWCRYGVAVPTGTTATAVLQARVTGSGNSAAIEVLDGPVPASGIRVNRAYVVRAGASSGFGDAAAGNIVIGTNPASSTTMAQTAQAIIPSSLGGRSWNFAPNSGLMVPRGRVGLLYPDSIAASTDRSENARAKIVVRQWGQPAQTWGESEIALGFTSAKLGAPVRVAGRGEVVLLFARDASGSNVDVFSTIQMMLLLDASDPDPHPELQPPPFG